jgi:hypothetical protein
MAEQELSNGEIARTLQRHDEDIAAAATKEALAEFKGEVREKFKRAEATAIERRDALRQKDKELGERIDGIEKGRAPKIANWIAAGVLAIAAITLLVTLLGQGGR